MSIMPQQQRVDVVELLPDATLWVFTPKGAWWTEQGRLGFVEWMIYSLEGWDSTTGRRLYWRKDSFSNADPTPDLTEAQFAVKGSARWDGKFAWTTDHECELSATDMEEVQSITRAIERAYVLAGSLVFENEESATRETGR